MSCIIKNLIKKDPANYPHFNRERIQANYGQPKKFITSQDSSNQFSSDTLTEIKKLTAAVDSATLVDHPTSPLPNLSKNSLSIKSGLANYAQGDASDCD